MFRFKAPKDRRGHEQAGARFAVVLQADELAPLSTVIVAPTSASAPPRAFRPCVDIGGVPTSVLVEQLRAVHHARLGELVGSIARREQQEIDRALALVLGLTPLI
ncbi:MAG TPA: type II toxin-antitoxin system PemK/MazF family toxin [Gaiellaceae bacterium]|nr:type II toxin-antitoxin system PemK/MazF family toxin [Gaiellaceae bacterium]